MTTSKYCTLGEYLLQQEDQITLSFSEIEEILGFPLPKSARKFRTWWANDNKHSHAVNGWLTYGWRVNDIDLKEQYIRFRKTAKLRLHKSVTTSKSPPEGPTPKITQVRLFEAKAREVTSEHFGIKLRPGLLQKVSKLFDFVSKDKTIVGEAKFLSVGKKRFQPAKFSAISEVVWLLEKIQAKHKFIVFGSSNEIPKMWLSRYGALLDDITFYFLDEGKKLEKLN
ncbi:MAG: hypothetical protein ACFE89_02840 [Candidatus Hodarchaeota archaeon]